MNDGYAYTTITAEKDEPTRITVSFHLDQHAWIAVPGKGTDRVHLNISYGDVSVSIAPAPGEITARDVQIARTLADETAAYAAEVERLSTGKAAVAA